MILPRDITETAITLKDQFFDLRGLSVYSALSVPALRQYLKTGLPHYRLKGKILIKRSEFDAWLRQYRVNSTRDLKDIVNGAMRDLSNKTFDTDKN